ncbi:MAG: DnaJ domain-containing protein [Deltaproteobacteria bacterium]|nr:DnaJ domain-containing protein [Deltaproteobacteria bacterium]
MPYDLFPDFFIGLGWIDDIIILFLLWWYIYVYRRRKYRYEGYSEKSRGPSKENRGESDIGEDSSQAGYDSRQKNTPKTPYMVLGIERDASGEEIKTAYRQLAGKYHPDKLNHLGEEFKELAEKRFKEIQAAYQELMEKQSADRI